MHDPYTVAFEIRYPWKKWGIKGSTDFETSYREAFITIWHRDPEKDGSDDSCGWFMRTRHGDPDFVEKLKKDFAFQYAHGWFDKDGQQLLSTMAIALGMFTQASWNFHNHNRRRHDKFLQKYIADILHFAENNVDSMHDTITNKYRRPKEEIIGACAHMVYGCMLRWTRPWYKHPRWHFWHWSIQFHPLQNLKRRFWLKCSRCGKRGFKDTPIGNWSGMEIWHSTCSDVHPIPQEKEAA